MHDETEPDTEETAQTSSTSIHDYSIMTLSDSHCKKFSPGLGRPQPSKEELPEHCGSFYLANELQLPTGSRGKPTML
eukprot:m.186198 g.186198  ORF g.186198 m.186198 type:complete len:77 (+) comp39342_c0_seq5:757-987(+)